MAAQLTQALEVLGCPVTVSPGAPPGPTALHLARLLIALAEQHAIHAEQAAAGDADPADVDLFTYQDTYDKATAGVEALRAELTGADAQQHPEDADPLAEPSPLALVWDLIGPAAAAVEGLLAMEADLTVTDDLKAMVA